MEERTKFLSEMPTEDDALLRDLIEAHTVLFACFDEIGEVLDQPSLNKAALTTLRLKLASIRLTRGALVARLMKALLKRVTMDEAQALAALQCGHQELLRLASRHTGRWTLEVITREWQTYQAETRALVQRWKAKAANEQRVIYPILERHLSQRLGREQEAIPSSLLSSR